MSVVILTILICGLSFCMALLSKDEPQTAGLILVVLSIVTLFLYVYSVDEHKEIAWCYLNYERINSTQSINLSTQETECVALFKKYTLAGEQEKNENIKAKK